MLQPICGYVLDVLGLKLGFAIFAIAWSLISMAHGLANSWQALCGLRGLLGFAEGSANPAGMKATAEWFPAQERGLAGGVFNIGASVGSMLAPPLVVWAILTYNWQIGVRHHRRASASSGSALWLLALPVARPAHPALSADGARATSSPGRSSTCRATARGRRSDGSSRQRNFWGIALPRFLADPTWGTLTFWVPLYLTHGAALRSEADRALRLAAVPGRRPRLHVRRRHQRWRCRRRGVSLINARRGAFTVGAVLMIGMGFVGFVDSPYAAIALLCLGGFAHQTLSVTVITMSSDLFKRNEVATVAGMAGTCGNAGVLIFSLLIGGAGRRRSATRRSSSASPCSISSARWCCGRSCASRDRTAPRERGRVTRLHADTASSAIRSFRGFNPDPSIVRVGDDYYIATSTFEWFPGVQIHHSRDLVHWRLLTRPLDAREPARTCSAIPTRAASGRRASRYADGLFYLIYTDVKRYGRTTVGGASGASLRDFHNYLVTSPTHRRRLVRSGLPQQQRLRSVALPRRRRPEVPRSTCSGIIGPGQNRFAGIVLQEYSRRRSGGSIGERAEHLRGHAARLHRSAASLQARRLLLPAHRRGRHRLGPRGDDGALARRSTGPYELHPDVYILSARDRPDVELQRAGHADLVETPDGETYMVYLCGRPLPQSRPLHARPRDRDPADGVGRGRLAADGGRRRAFRSVEAPAPSAAARMRFPRATGARGLRRPRPADRLPVAAHRRGPTSSSA